MRELLFSVDLPIELFNDNDGRGSSHWRSTNRRKKIEEMLFDFKRDPLDERVDIVVTRVLGKGQARYDADSLGRGNAKELIDSLAALGWWRTDGPKWIRDCDYRQEEPKVRGKPYTRIDVYRIGDE